MRRLAGTAGDPDQFIITESGRGINYTRISTGETGYVPYNSVRDQIDVRSWPMYTRLSALLILI